MTGSQFTGKLNVAESLDVSGSSTFQSSLLVSGTTTLMGSTQIVNGIDIGTSLLRGILMYPEHQMFLVR